MHPDVWRLHASQKEYCSNVRSVPESGLANWYSYSLMVNGYVLCFCLFVFVNVVFFVKKRERIGCCGLGPLECHFERTFFLLPLLRYSPSWPYSNQLRRLLLIIHRLIFGDTTRDLLPFDTGLALGNCFYRVYLPNSVKGIG